MRKGSIMDVLTSVDIWDIFKMGGKVIEIYKGVFCRENFKIFPLRKVIEILLTSRQKYEGEKNVLLQRLV